MPNRNSRHFYFMKIGIEHVTSNFAQVTNGNQQPCYSNKINLYITAHLSFLAYFNVKRPRRLSITANFFTRLNPNYFLCELNNNLFFIFLRFCVFIARQHDLSHRNLAYGWSSETCQQPSEVNFKPRMTGKRCIIINEHTWDDAEKHTPHSVGYCKHI
jgi:hypothetical protein